jgi:hypothetical protein
MRMPEASWVKRCRVIVEQRTWLYTHFFLLGEIIEQERRKDAETVMARAEEREGGQRHETKRCKNRESDL